MVIDLAKVLIVYHTLSGNTEKMAKAFADGARSVPGTEAVLKKAFDASLEDLLGCDAIAFGSADYFSYIAGARGGEWYKSKGIGTLRGFG